MNIDVIIGSPGDDRGIAAQYNLGPNTLTNISPLAAVEAIQKKAGSPGVIERLRVFILRADIQFPTAQFARLKGLFTGGAAVEIFVPPSIPGGPLTASPGGPTGASTPAKSGFGGFAGSANIGGGLNFGGFSGATTAGGSFEPSLLHLSSLLGVSVSIRQL